MDVLLVEDEPVMAITASRRLSKFDIEVEHVGSGEKALEKVSNQNYDLILMDIGLPGIDGIETTKRIREANKGIIIIALSANYEGSVIEQCRAAGMNSGLMKPLNDSKIKEILDEYFPEIYTKIK